MNVFLVAAIALVGATLLMLLRPWKGHRAEQEATARELNARIYRDQLAELDRDLAAGTLAAAGHAQARTELQRRLLEDTAGAEAAPAPVARATRTTLSLALALPLAAAALYASFGTPAALAPHATERAAEPTMAEVQRMVDALAERLEKQPDDPKGWSMLARSYHVMSRHADAAKAFARIGPALDGSPDLLAAYADTLASLAQGNLEGRPLQLATAALKIDPDHAMSLSLVASAAYDRRDFAAAARHWQRLLKQLPPESEDAKFVERMLAEMKAAGPPGAASH